MDSFQTIHTVLDKSKKDWYFLIESYIFKRLKGVEDCNVWTKIPLHNS